MEYMRVTSRELKYVHLFSLDKNGYASNFYTLCGMWINLKELQEVDYDSDKLPCCDCDNQKETR